MRRILALAVLFTVAGCATKNVGDGAAGSRIMWQINSISVDPDHVGSNANVTVTITFSGGKGSYDFDALLFGIGPGAAHYPFTAPPGATSASVVIPIGHVFGDAEMKWAIRVDGTSAGYQAASVWADLYVVGTGLPTLSTSLMRMIALLRLPSEARITLT